MHTDVSRTKGIKENAFAHAFQRTNEKTKTMHTKCGCILLYLAVVNYIIQILFQYWYRAVFFFFVRQSLDVCYSSVSRQTFFSQNGIGWRKRSADHRDGNMRCSRCCGWIGFCQHSISTRFCYRERQREKKNRIFSLGFFWSHRIYIMIYLSSCILIHHILDLFIQHIVHTVCVCVCEVDEYQQIPQTGCPIFDLSLIFGFFLLCQSY